MFHIRFRWIILLLISVFAGTSLAAKQVNKPKKLLVSQDTLVRKYIFYKPQVQSILPREIDETSGLIFWNNSLFTINDSGNEPILYRIDTVNGKILQRIRIKDAKNTDWEALTQDARYIYIGDVGDNYGVRRELTIFKLDKTTIPDQGDVTLPAKIIRFRFPENRPNEVGRQHNNFDCESLVSINDSLYFFSKNWGDQHTRCYRLPKTAGSYTAEYLFSYPVKGLITAATYQKNSKTLALLGYTKGDWIPFIWIFYDFKNHHFFDGKKIRIDMPQIIATQTEGITFTHGLRGFISSEGNKLFYQTMDRIDLQSFLTKTNKRTTSKANKELKLDLSQVLHKENQWKLVLPQKICGDVLQLSLYDNNGKEYNDFSTHLVRQNKRIQIMINMEPIPQGSYVLKVSTDGSVWELPLEIEKKK